MIHISQGHEESIGLEVLLKSLLTIPTKYLDQLVLHCFKDTLTKHLEILNIDHHVNEAELKINNISIQVQYLEKSDLSETLTSLDSAISECGKGDVLLTLPSSKDQFVKNDFNNNGHTEYLRNIYDDSNLSMAFVGPLNNVLLLTDHIPVREIANQINTELILNKVSKVLDNITSIREIKRVMFSGINPHCGEQGLMGDEEKHIEQAIIVLKDKYKDVEFIGPISGDTLQFLPSNKSDLLVYAAHDQGLAPFKTTNGLLGINVTFGLPFLRVSPDHGTAFYLYGKNEANYQGMLFVLNKILKILT